MTTDNPEPAEAPTSAGERNLAIHLINATPDAPMQISWTWIVAFVCIMFAAGFYAGAML